MPVDKGGLDYNIVTSANLGALDAFRQGLADARFQMKALRADLAGLGSSSGAAKTALQGAAVAARAAATAAKDSAAAVRSTAAAEKARQKVVKEGTKVLGIREEAERKYAKAVQAAAVSREFARISEENNFRLQRRTLTLAQSQVEAAKKVTAVLNKQKIAQEILNDIRARGVSLSDRELASLGVLTDAQKRLAQAKERLAKAQDVANNAQLRGLRIQEQVLSKQSAGKDREEIARRLFLLGLDKNGNPLPPTRLTTSAKKAVVPPVVTPPAAPQQKTFGDLLKSALGIQQATEQAEFSTNRIAFTFRRLIGIFAAFTLIRKGVQAFGDLVNNAIRFNAQIESAQLGLAGIIQAVGNVRDVQGSAVDAATSFALAQKIAGREIKALRRDALATTASLEQLIEAFQVALAPGLQAGLGIVEIRKFSVSIAQAATAIGLSQRQLAEEIRSILSGSINTRNTRIATALGITNADIRMAKELGTLSDFLNRKFKAFTQVGEQLGKTFEGSLTRAGSALQLVNQEASIPLFDQVKGLLQDIFKIVVDVNKETGDLSPDPQVLAGFRSVFEALGRVVGLVREGLGNFDSGKFQAVAQSIAVIVESLGTVAVGVISGLATGLKQIVGLFITIRNILKSITGIDVFDAKGLAATIQYLAKILTLFFGIRFVLFVAVTSVIKMVVAFKAARAAVIAIRAAVVGTSTVIAAATVAAKGLRAALLSSGGGILVILAAVAASEALERSGLLDKIFSGSKDVADSFETLEEVVARTFGEIPGQIQTAAESLKTFDETLRSILSASDKVRGERRIRIGDVSGDVSGISAVGLDGPVAEQVKATIASFIDLQEKLRDIGREQKANDIRLLQIALKHTEVEKKLSEVFADNAKSFDVYLQERKQIASFNEQEVELIREIGKINADPAAAVADEFERASAILKQNGLSTKNLTIDINELLKTLTDRLAKVRALRIESIRNISDDPAKQKEFVELLAAEAALQGESVVIEEELRNLVDARKELERAVNRELNERIALLAEEAAFQLSISNITLEAELAATRTRNQARRSSPAIQEFADARAVTIELEAQAQVERIKLDLKTEQLDKIIQLKKLETEIAQIALAAAQASGDPRATEIAVRQVEAAQIAVTNLTAQQVELEREKLALLGLQEERIREQARLQDEKRIKAGDGPDILFQQVTLSLQTLADDLPNQFEIIFSTLRDGIRGFSDFVSSSIVDAFDPTKKVDLKERFAAFLRSLASQIISTLVQIAVTRALLGLSGFFPVGAARGGVIEGFAKGGDVRRHGAGRRRRGFAEGGQLGSAGALPTAPAGLDSRDRVPVFARVGEWLVPPEKGAIVGSDFMWDLIHGRIDPTAARALTTVRGRGKQAASGKPQGFASGGVVGGQAAAATAAAPASPAGGLMPAYVVSNDQTVERLLAGGRSAAIRFFQDNGFVRK